jgi:serine/threonine protein kinase
MEKPPSPPPPEGELLTVGACSATHRLGESVVRTVRIDDDPEVTRGNALAMTAETNAYKILGAHDQIATCLYISPIADILVLPFYKSGDLRQYAIDHGTNSHLYQWARQMIEAVAFIHSKGVRHSDIKLSQWLLDKELNARLSDFNACGFDEQPALDLDGIKALGYEQPSHFMPRDPARDNTVRSDLFALGSALYELERGRCPYTEVREDLITGYFATERFPSLVGLTMGSIIAASWKGEFLTATQMLQAGAELWGAI